MLEFIKNYYFLFIAFLSIAVFYALQYLTRGINYFIDEKGKIRTRFLCFMASLQFLISLIITWIVVSAFSSEYLSEYETIKMTAIIVIGGAPFNITTLLWVALKLEAFKFMKKRYGKDFQEETLYIEKKENFQHDEKIKIGSKNKENST